MISDFTGDFWSSVCTSWYLLLPSFSVPEKIYVPTQTRLQPLLSWTVVTLAQATEPWIHATYCSLIEQMILYVQHIISEKLDQRTNISVLASLKHIMVFIWLVKYLFKKLLTQLIMREVLSECKTNLLKYFKKDLIVCIICHYWKV